MPSLWPGFSLLLLGVAQALMTAHQVPPEKDTLVILRSHKPSVGMQHRLLSMAMDVMRNMPSAHLLVSVDDTDLAPGQQWYVPLKKEHVHRYSWSDVSVHWDKISWPSMLDPSMRHTNAFHATGRNFHMEPVWLALEYAKTHVPIAKTANVWALEDDVLVCGRFSEIVKAYANDTSDLLSSGVQPAVGWVHANMCSPAFKVKYPMFNRRLSPEFVERFSVRLLEHIHELGQKNNITANSEMFAPTVCNQDGFSHGFYKSEHLGRWNWDIRIGMEEAQHICQQQGVFMNHAAKLFSNREAREASGAPPQNLVH